ncbi:hypothetical protein CsSME_00042466 [Camellia sinensis var. sinensis]
MAIDYCSKHADSKKISEEADLKKFDSEFVAKKDLAVLFKLVSAANYLDVKGLSDQGFDARGGEEDIQY